MFWKHCACMHAVHCFYWKCDRDWKTVNCIRYKSLYHFAPLPHTLSLPFLWFVWRSFVLQRMYSNKELFSSISTGNELCLRKKMMKNNDVKEKNRWEKLSSNLTTHTYMHTNEKDSNFPYWNKKLFLNILMACVCMYYG